MGCNSAQTLDLTAPRLNIKFTGGSANAPIIWYVPQLQVFNLSGYSASLKAFANGIVLPVWDLSTVTGGLSIVQGNPSYPDPLTGIATPITGAWGIQINITTDMSSQQWDEACYSLVLTAPSGQVIPTIAQGQLIKWGCPCD